MIQSPADRQRSSATVQVERPTRAAGEAPVFISAKKLAGWIERLLMEAGVDIESAQIVADCLVQADMKGTTSHGVSRMPIYLKRLDAGLVSAGAIPKIEKETQSGLLINAGGGFGHPAAIWAAERCVAKARNTGVSVAGVLNSTHFGMASYYAEFIAKAGMIGLATTNSSARMAPWGAVDALFGTNPLAIAVPSDDGVVVLDIATSVAALGKITEAAARGDTIPADWALDVEGNPTTDPAAALRGTVLPFAGPKGSGLAFMLDVLAGVLTGGCFGPDVGSLYRDWDKPEQCGHFLIAIDIEGFLPLPEFRQRIANYVKVFKASAPRPGFKEVLLPGELERRRQRVSERHGIALEPHIYSSLIKIANDRDVPLD